MQYLEIVLPAIAIDAQETVDVVFQAELHETYNQTRELWGSDVPNSGEMVVSVEWTFDFF